MIGLVQYRSIPCHSGMHQNKEMEREEERGRVEWKKERKGKRGVERPRPMNSPKGERLMLSGSRVEATEVMPSMSMKLESRHTTR